MHPYSLTAEGDTARQWMKNPRRRPPGCYSFREIAQTFGTKRTVVERLVRESGLTVVEMAGVDEKFIRKADLPVLLVLHPKYTARVEAKRRGR